tara:strand:+ start:541 stop:1176 length:636 start_codon:yes stop_codon:yes gene_type:complete
MKNTMPFTYLITHIQTGMRYYGSKSSKGCSPEDLGKSYFSSSKRIKRIILDEGVLAFKFEVRKTFGSMEEAVRWEARFLRRIQASKSKDWFNMHNGDGNFVNKGGYRLTETTKSRMRKPKSESHREKLKIHLDNKRVIPEWTDIRKSSQSKFMVGNQINKGREPYNKGKEFPGTGVSNNQSAKGFFWWNNGAERIRSKIQPEGYVRGRGTF